MLDHASVVIIGGGAVGASCLYHLTCAGINDCLLIEKDELTSGSTWHAAGNIPTYATSWLGMRAGNYAWQIYKDLNAADGTAITYRHTGAFWPAHNRDRMDLYHHLVGVSRSAGFELAILTPAEMEAMHPYYLAGDSVIGGIHDPYEGDIDPSQLTQALAGNAREAGAEIARFTTVIAITRNHDNEWIITTDKGVVTCEHIVNATGFYGAAVADLVGQQLPVATLQHQYLVTDALPALNKDDNLFPLVRDPDIRFYLRREGAGLLFGSYAHPGRLAFCDGIPDQFAHGLFEDSPDDIVDLIAQAIEHVPLLREAGLRRFVNGPIGYSPDALPLCGPAHGLPNFYHACGIQIGITHSAAAGKAITEWITEGDTEWDYAAWDPRRFGDWASPDYARDRIVELYDLQYAIPFPHRIIQSGRPVRCSPLYQTLQKKGAVFGQIGGWERAFWFDVGGINDPVRLSFRNDEPWQAGVRRECEAVRDGVGIMDHCGFTKYSVTGPGASAYLDRVFCSQLPEVGRVRLSYMLTPKGRIWSEATIARLDSDRFLLCGPTLADLRDYDWLHDQLPDNESVQLTHGNRYDAALLLMGPKSRELLSRLTDVDLSAQAMPWMSVSEIVVAGESCIAMRVSYVGELGWELHLESASLSQVYAEICRVGDAYGLADFGSWSLNAMRIEKAYHGWGADFGTEYTMYDAGLEKFIDFTKSDFVGRDAVLQQRADPVDWEFVRLMIDIDDAEPLPGDPIMRERECVGYITSASGGYRLNQCVALGYMKAGRHLSNLEVEILGQPRPALQCETAFYDPESRLCRG
ncbi:MAG: FAD-dependent oxidoreductase [Pseudomonadota bacterium]|nr:FAD-dependent oxidoreductase [Pseudomonadota bacterium]